MKKTKYKKINKSKYIIHFITRAFFISILCFVILFGIIVSVYLGDLLLKGKGKNPLFSTYVIVSPSMVPTIKINDAIVIKREDNDNYKVGDVITFTTDDANYEDMHVTHRIVNKQNLEDGSSIYTTKGDNNMVIDPFSVKTDNIQGKVLFKVPKIGYIKNFFSKPLNYFLCLLIPAMVFVFYDFIKIIFIMDQRKA